MATPDGYAHAVMKFIGNAAPTGAAITFGLDVTVFAGGPEVAAANIVTAWNTCGIEAQLTNNITQSSVLVKFGPDATGPSAEVAGAGPGTNAGQTWSPNTAFLVRKVTDLGGRSGRGRFYIPGGIETMIDASGVMLPATVLPIQSAMTSFLEKLNTDDMPMVVLHRPGAPLSAPTFVEALQVQSVVATQRRRLRR